jgi:hypothetical protein
MSERIPVPPASAKIDRAAAARALLNEVERSVGLRHVTPQRVIQPRMDNVDNRLDNKPALSTALSTPSKSKGYRYRDPQKRRAYCAAKMREWRARR